MVDRVSLEGLARRIGAGESVFVPGSSGEPVEFTEMLARDIRLARDARFIVTFVPGINPHNLAPLDGDRRMQVFFHSPAYAGARRQGLIEFLPLTYSTLQRRFEDPATRIDTVVVQVGTPRADGQCPLGPAVEFLPGILRREVRVLAVVNPHVPDFAGSSCIPMDRFDCYAESHAPLAHYDAGASNDASDRIAEQVLALIPSGATVQIGLGKVPSRLVRGLRGRRDLAFHTGLLSDSILDLYESGALRREAPMTTTVAVGTLEFYRRLSGLSGLRIAGVDHTHDAAVLAGFPRLFAVNSAIEVDLLGQVNAETIGGRYVSGPGGLPDFSHAARRSAEGLSIIALNATDGSGRQSKIIPAIQAGTPVTVPQHDVDVVVTEWGAAMLRGCDPDERARRIVAIAHPDHRPHLRNYVPH